MLSINYQRGQSILEVIVAMAIFSLIGAAMVAMVVGSFIALTQGGEQTQAEALAQEGIEAVRSIRDGAWNENIYSQSAVATSTGQWVFSGEGTDETIGQYSRTITFSNVCRDGSDDITTCPGSYTDVHSKEVSVDVSWETREGITNTVQRIAYLTNWDSRDWTQTNWSGGNGQSQWSNESKYDSDDGNVDIDTAGEVKLVCGGSLDSGFGLPTGTSYDWSFTTAENYTYDSDKIEVIGGYAQLVSSGGSSATGTTANEEFTSNADNWTFYTWGVGGGEVTPTGNWQSSGGNPSGYVDINIPYNAKNDELGGYWEQPITITENGVTVTCFFDWKVVQWVANDSVDDYQFYVFLDGASGAPTIGNEVWSSGTQSGTTSWSGQQSIDCSSVASASSSYYYKIAVWLDTKSGKNTGPITAGYDNAKVYWSKIESGAYSADEPDVYPTASYSVPGVKSWDMFTETATKNGGEVYYQLSDNDGSSWQYWNGSNWTTASGDTDYNPSTVVSANINSFSTSSEQIKFKAFLESDGSQFVRLDNIHIEFTAPDPAWTFSTWDIDGGEVTPSGNYQSSGGNPDGYVDITVPRGGGYEVGGYWQQEFTTVVDNPSGVSVDFDYKVFDFNDSPNVAELRVYIDTSSGDPLNQVGNSISISGEGSWISTTLIDASSTITTAGTYYLKIAFWVETPPGGGPNATGPFTVGYDNVSLDLGDGIYPTSGYLISSAFDMSTSSSVQVIEWDETTPGQDFEIKFQIQTAAMQEGLSSAEWSGPEGKDGDGTDYFSTSTGQLIHTDHNGDQWIRYKTIFSGDGSDTPVLEEVKINYK